MTTVFVGTEGRLADQIAENKATIFRRSIMTKRALGVKGTHELSSSRSPGESTNTVDPDPIRPLKMLQISPDFPHSDVNE